MRSGPILVVDDAPDHLETVASYLESQGLACLRASDAHTMREMLQKEQPALVILDINLPDHDGIELARELRLADKAGLIFLTSRNEDRDELAGLEVGAHDYITKPVNLPILLARIKGVLRRSSETVIVFHGWTLDLIRRELFKPNGELLPLTSGEFNILSALVSQRPQPVTRDFLLDVISNRDPREISDFTVNTLIARLRRKMVDGTGNSPIQTVRGVGYAIVGED